MTLLVGNYATMILCHTIPLHQASESGVIVVPLLAGVIWYIASIDMISDAFMDRGVLRRLVDLRFAHSGNGKKMLRYSRSGLKAKDEGNSCKRAG